MFRVDPPSSEAVGQAAQNRCRYGKEPAEISLGDGIVSGQLGDRNLTGCLAFSQEQLNAPPLANQFNDLHGYLHIPA